jgi:hypothetical protein
MSNFGGTPWIGMVTTGSAGMFRLRRRIRSDFAQHDSGNAANAVKGVFSTCQSKAGIILMWSNCYLKTFLWLTIHLTITM